MNGAGPPPGFAGLGIFDSRSQGFARNALHPGLYAAAHIRGLRKEKNFMITIDDSIVGGETEEFYDHD